MIPLPWAAFAVAFLSIVLYFTGHHKGWTERDQEMQVEIAKKNDEARSKELKLNEDLNIKTNELKEANDVVNKKQVDLNRLIAAGRVRLPTPSCVQASTSATTTAGNSSQETSESDRETLRLIAEIAAEGDRAINQLNACIEAYEQVRKAANGNS